MPEVITNRKGPISYIRFQQLNIKTVRKQGGAPLHTAARCNRPRVVRSLLRTRAACNSKDKLGRTPLHIAVRANATAALGVLLRHPTIKLNARMRDGNTPLIYAVRAGLKVPVVKLLRAGANVDAMDRSRQTALHIAVQQNCYDLMVVLLENGANANFEDETRRTPLHIAAVHNRLNMVKRLFDAGADAAKQDKYSQTPLHIAVALRAVNMVRALLRHQPKTVDIGLQFGKTPLMTAVFFGMDSIVKALIDAGADVCKADCKGTTALHWAANFDEFFRNRYLVEHWLEVEMAGLNKSEMSLHFVTRRAKIARILIDAGADVCARDNLRNTPFHTVLESKSVAELISDCRWEMIVAPVRSKLANVNAANRGGKTVLHYAVLRNCKSLVNELLENEADTEAQDFKDQTPLHIAATCDNADIVKMLLKAGANANARDKYGQTPLQSVLLLKKAEKVLVVDQLINGGVDINAVDDQGMTALHWVAKHNAISSVNILPKFGVNVNAQNKQGQTPIHLAAKYWVDAGMTQALLNAGAAVDVRDCYGHAPLITAAHLGRDVMLTYLINAGADVNESDCRGDTALHWAADFLHVPANELGEDETSPYGRPPTSERFATRKASVARKLLDAGADANARNNHGDTPLHTAANSEALAVFRVLIEHPATDVDARRADDGKTALMILESDYMLAAGAFEDLLKAGADINARDREEMSLLHYGMIYDDIDEVHYLLECGANVNLQDGNGETPLHLAARGGSLETCRLLLRRFADRDIPNHMGKLPRDIASDMVHQRIVMLLTNECMPGG